MAPKHRRLRFHYSFFAPKHRADPFDTPSKPRFKMWRVQCLIKEMSKKSRLINGPQLSDLWDSHVNPQQHQDLACCYSIFSSTWSRRQIGTSVVSMIYIGQVFFSRVVLILINLLQIQDAWIVMGKLIADKILGWPVCCVPWVPRFIDAIIEIGWFARSAAAKTNFGSFPPRAMFEHIAEKSLISSQFWN